MIKVLIIEDDSEVQGACAALFKDGGIESLQAFNTDDALRLFSSHCQDISAIMLDYHVPGGLTTVELARFMRCHYDGPIFATSTDEEMRRRLVDDGCCTQGMEKAEAAMRIMKMFAN